MMHVDTGLKKKKKWFDRDPLKLFRAYLIEHKIATEQEIVAIDDRIQDEVDEAVEYAQAAAEPALESALHDIYWEGEND